ncbi:unnamed protein product [Closterium sp. Naga37s-1]|nr:unnamed protein product [Closterium sp. Naga37s-1]
MSVLLSPVFPPFFTAPSFSPFTSASAAAGTHALAPASSSLSSTSAAASTPTPAPTCSSFSYASAAAGTHAQASSGPSGWGTSLGHLHAPPSASLHFPDASLSLQGTAPGTAALCPLAVAPSLLPSRLLVTAHLLSCLACPPRAPFLSLVSATRLFPRNLRALPSLGAPDPVFPFLLPFLPLHLAGIALLRPSSHVSLSRATFLLLRLFPLQPSSLPAGVLLLSHDALQHQPLRRWVTNVRYPCLAPSPAAAASLLASAERAFLRNPRPPPLPTTVAISFLPSPNASCPPGFVLARANDTRLLAQHGSSPPPLAPLTRAQLLCSCCASLHLHAVPWASDLPPCSPGVSRHSSASPLAHDLHPRRADDKEEAWVPVTKLGRLVKEGKIKSIEHIYLFSLPIKEHQIVEAFLPTLKDEVMKIMPVQKQTRAGQRTRFKAFVVVGDCNGHIGLGVKCAKEVATAIRGALILAKLSVIPVRRGYWGNKIGKPHTVPTKVTGKCGSVTVRLVPAPRGSGIVAARVPKKVLQFAGIEDVFTSSRGSTKTLGNFVKATFACLLNTYAFLTPDLWHATKFTKTPFQEFTDFLAKPHKLALPTAVPDAFAAPPPAAAAPRSLTKTPFQEFTDLLSKPHKLALPAAVPDAFAAPTPAAAAPVPTF